jgi:ABC-type transport system involved in multi-copper enzyme maturation permease subunit
MLNVITMSLKGIFRDRIFQGIIVAALLFIFVPSISVLSMRQVSELSITLCLSLISFILLLLAVFLGGTSLWRDIDRRYTHSVLGLPLSRSSYLVGRFVANAFFLMICSLVLSIAAFIVIYYCSILYPPAREIQWKIIAVAIFFDTMKYILLIAVSFFFSTISTSFFLPIFGTVSIFIVGCSSQDVFNYLHTADAGKGLPTFVVKAATCLYYLLPNLSAFDFKLHAVYGLEPSSSGLVLTFGYFVAYSAILLTISACLFIRREMK